MSASTTSPASRLRRLRKRIRALQLDALLATGERNVRWLTGFTGDSSWLLVTQDGATLISDFRFITQIGEECPGIETWIRSSGESLPAALSTLCSRLGVQRLGFEGQHVSVDTFRRCSDLLPAGTNLLSTEGEIERLRIIKDAAEIREVRTAVAIAERAWANLLSILTAESSERFLAAELEHALRRFGAEGFSFPGIVAVGDRAALPHYRPGGKKLAESPILLVDWGARLASGYCSDLTRTVLTGRIEKRFEKVYKTVLEAQQRAISRIGPGVRCGDVDAAARDCIAKAGFGEYFDHGTGHGIGLEVHEAPRLGTGVETVLEAGMVVTVEPGIYLPGWGGVRIEDDVLVTRHGCEVLSTVPKSWETVRVM